MKFRCHGLCAVRRMLLPLLSLLFCTAALAEGIELVEFDDAQHEQRYLELIRELRCLVCQNQSLADSNAPLAEDMREIIARKIREDASDDEIVGFMVDRYGNFVRYRPPFSVATAALWLLPFLLVVAAFALVPRWLGRQRPAQLSGEQRARAQQILDE